MVAVIKQGSSIRGAFLYNENKVKEGVAQCLMAVNYPMDAEQMTEQMRLNMLLKIAERRPSMKYNSIHISLNFAPEEQYNQAFLKELAQEYMERIGFGKQPYLIYQHYDSGHPHLHLVTTKITPDGGYIDTQNIGKNRSEPARKEIEIKHGLVKAEDHRKELFEPKAVNAAIVSYGKVPTKRAISSILSAVLNSYKYTSLPELNALLGLYNVMAQRGDEDSRMYKNKGLVYRIIGKDGRPISTPIKASAFHQKALLKDIEARFLKNDVERQKYKGRIKVAIDWNLRAKGMTMEKLFEKLKSEGITAVLRRSATASIYGITYVDHKTKCIFNGSDLGKQYSAAAIIERCETVENISKQQAEKVPERLTEKDVVKPINPSSEFAGKPMQNTSQSEVSKDDKGLVEQLMQAEYGSNYLPYELRKNPKKKKRKKSNRL